MLTQRPANRMSQPGGDTALMIMFGVFIITPVAAFSLAWLTAFLTGLKPAGLPQFVMQLAQGTAGWGITQTVVLIVMTLLVTIFATFGVIAVIKRRKRTKPVDAVARSMSHKGELAALSDDSVTTTAQRLSTTEGSLIGLPIGRSVLTGERLYTNVEWTQLWIMGPRAGKTSSVCVPQIVSSRTPVLATSNKPDLVHLTRGPRSEQGRVWVHDPQSLADEQATWTWDPLTWVTDVTKADYVVSLFTAASRDATAKTDAYFDSAADGLLSCLLLAAASSTGSLYDVLEWMFNPDEPAPIDALYAAGHSVEAAQLQAYQSKTSRQRDGIYGTAETRMSWLRSPGARQWIMPRPGATVFDPHAFVRSTDTLILLSKEGPGSTRALTSALTVAVTDAAEKYAISQGGRLATPLVCVLDEAANVCRWPQLPDLYSHYGSRGILLNTFLQSFSQGIRVWSREGMRQMWDAANLRGIGAGLADASFLEEVSKLVGDHDVATRSRSDSLKGGSTSHSIKRERMLDPSALAALPQGRAVALPAGMPPVLLELEHWSRCEHHEAIAASEAFYRTNTATPLMRRS